MRELLRSAFYLVTVDEGRALVRRARTHQRFESAEEIEAAYEEVLRSLEGIDLSRYALLVDLRDAPARNDPAFEKVLSRYYGRIFTGFRRMAILVRTEAGRLQVARLAQTLSLPLRVFLDEPSALAYLAVPGQDARVISRPPSR